MFGFFSKKMTEYSNHYVDWSRVGELIQSGTHRYSKDELCVRGGIIAFTAVSAFLGANLNDSKKTNCSNLTMSLVSCVLGFVVSHTIVILPLIKKRYEMSKDCERLEKEIRAKMRNIHPSLGEKYSASIESVIQRILKLSLSDDKHSKASQTWGNRKHLLSNVSERLNVDTFEPAFWEEDVESILKNLANISTGNRYTR